MIVGAPIPFIFEVTETGWKFCLDNINE